MPSRPCWAARATPGLDWTKRGRSGKTGSSGSSVLPVPEQQLLTTAQQELYDWLADYIGANRHSPSIRQMMEAMGLRSPAPIQSRLRHLQQKGWITWQEGQARTLQLLGGLAGGIPVLGAVAAGGLVETFDDVQEHLDLAPVLDTRGLFALTVNGDSMWMPTSPMATWCCWSPCPTPVASRPARSSVPWCPVAGPPSNTFTERVPR